MLLLQLEDEHLFLLDEALSFRSGTLEGDRTFAWRDLQGDPGDMWEYVCNTKMVTPSTSSIFEVTVLHCMYERVSLSPFSKESDSSLSTEKRES